MPRSWFLILIDNETKITNESLTKMLGYKNKVNEKVFSLASVKRDLHHLISKIAVSNKLQNSQKRSVFQMVKKIFGFENE